MTVKELKELVAALPDELDDCVVYAAAGETAEDARRVDVYNEETHAKNYGTPYCQGDKPWEYAKKADGKWGFVEWKGLPNFVVIEG
jgi:hypothetical protein